MHRDVLLDAQTRQDKSPFTGYGIRSPHTKAFMAWFAEEHTAQTFAVMIRARGAKCEVVPVIGVVEVK